MQSYTISLTAPPRLKSTRLPAKGAVHAFTLMFLLLVLCLFSIAAMGQKDAPPPQIWAKPTVGPPTTTVYVSGSGFDPFALVAIYFDDDQKAWTLTDSKGNFGVISPKPKPTPGGIPIVVPKKALPGTHLVTAVEPFGIKNGQKPFLVRTDWAQFRFDPSRKGFNPYENVLSPDTVGNIDLHWIYQMGDTYYSPAVADGVVYVASFDGPLYALNASSGELLWQYHVNGIYCSPAVANGVVYVGSVFDGTFYALKATSGELLWKYTSGSFELSSPAVANGVVYFGSYDGNLHALSAATGELLWKYTTGEGRLYSPAVANGIVYVASADNLYALNARTGTLLWTYPAAGTKEAGTAAVANGVVYAGCADGLCALNATTGSLLWKYPGGGIPVVANGVAYTGCADGLCALNAGTGDLLWTRPTSVTLLSVANGVLYVTSDHDRSVYALNASTGSFLWGHLFYNSALSSFPVVANGVVYITSIEGYDLARLYAFALPGGSSPGKFSPPERPDPVLLKPDWSLRPSTSITK